MIKVSQYFIDIAKREILAGCFVRKEGQPWTDSGLKVILQDYIRVTDSGLLQSCGREAFHAALAEKYILPTMHWSGDIYRLSAKGAKLAAKRLRQELEALEA